MKFPSPVSGPNQLIVLGAIGFVLLLLIAGLIFKQEAVTNYAQSKGNWLDNPRSLTAIELGSKGSLSRNYVCEVGEEYDDDCQCNDGSVIDPVATPGERCPVLDLDADDVCHIGLGSDGDCLRERFLGLCTVGSNPGCPPQPLSPCGPWCAVLNPNIWGRSYNPLAGQSFDTWVSSDDNWSSVGTLTGPLFSTFQIKWDAEELLTTRERFSTGDEGGVNAYRSAFFNCRLDHIYKDSMGLEISRSILGEGRRGSYTGKMDIKSWLMWLNGARASQFEIVCENLVFQYAHGIVTDIEVQPAVGPMPIDADISRRYTHAGMGFGVATQCEVPFDQIVESLNSVNITRITENTFRGWASNDSFDDCDYNINGACLRLNPTAYANRELLRRSGDVDDIKTAMVIGQCNSATIPDPDDMVESFNRGEQLLNDVALSTRNNRPTTLAFALSDLEYDPEDRLFVDNLFLNFRGYHIVVVLDVEIEETNSGSQYTVKVLDPTGPKVHNVICQEFEITHDGDSADLVICNFDGKTGLPFSSELRDMQILRTRYTTSCPDSGANDVSNPRLCGRRPDLSGWLENNYPQINNFGSITSPAGNCFGWVDFVLRTTYLGDFVGECPHPISFNL